MTVNIIYINIGVFIFGGIAATSIILFFVKNPEKLDYLLHVLFKLISYIPLLRGKFSYGKIASTLQAHINSASVNINQQAPNILPHIMKIEWTKSGQDAATFLRDGEIIVKIAHEEDNDRNMVLSTLAYLSKGLIPQSRHCLDKNFMQATEFTTAKEIFTISKQNSAITYFINNFLAPQIQENPEIGEDCSNLDILRYEGIFTRMLLKQFEFLGKKMYASTPNVAVQKESREFMNYLLEITLKSDTGITPPLDFLHPRIRVRTLLVAKKETKQWGKKPYVNRIKEAQTIGMEYLYILAWGKSNIDFAKSIAKEQETAGRLSILKINEYTRSSEHERSLPTTCIVTALNINASDSHVSESTSALLSILEENVQEIRDGKIEIISVAREPGKVSKIIVKPLIDGIDAVRCITEKIQNGSLDTALSPEILHIFLFDDDPAKLITSALLNKKLREKIDKIELNNEDKLATVTIDDNDTRKVAVGKNGVNVKLASVVTGWEIDVIKN